MSVRVTLRRFQAQSNPLVTSFRCKSGPNGRIRSQTVAFSSHSTSTLPVETVTVDGYSDASDLQSQLKTIVEPYFKKQQPVFVKGALMETPATKLWSSWDYWQEAAVDDPMVAVEIGGSYGTDGSQRAEIPFAAYLQFLQLFEERHGRQGDLHNKAANAIPTEELVYMAQNDLLQPLYKDVFIPDFCQSGSDDDASTSDDAISASSSQTSIGLGRLYSVMMWLGPRGSYSPLHYDPLDNILMQHMGRKRVLLMDPSHNSDHWHYAGHDGQQKNTSPFDPELLDENSDDESRLQTYKSKYPLFFEKAPPRMEGLLEPGDFLYIPSKWWHHVRSIDTSASVNVWWR